MFVIFSLNLYSSINDAFSDKARGQTVFAILRSPVSPYFYSIGGGGSAVMIEDNIFLNPASMYFNNANSVFIGFQKNNVESSRTDLAYIFRKGYKVSGFTLSYIDYGNFIAIDNNGNITGEFSPYDFIFSYAYGWGRKERFGIRIKYIESNLVYEKMRGLCLDSGFSIKGDKSVLSILVRNIGPSVESDKKYYSLPLEISVGFDYIYSSSIRGIFDLRFPSDNKTHAILGFEYSLDYKDLTLKLRGGLDTLNFRELGIGGIVAGGFGVNIGSFGLEYSFIPYSNIDNTHRILLKYNFGEVKYKEEVEYKFKEFIAKEISLKKKIVVFGFNYEDITYGNVIANSIEERLIEKKHAVISRLDPVYISHSKLSYNDSFEVISSAKEMNADYAVWGKIEKQDEIKAIFTMYVFSIKSGKTMEYSFVSNIYDIRNIALKLADEISLFIEE